MLEVWGIGHELALVVEFDWWGWRRGSIGGLGLGKVLEGERRLERGHGAEGGGVGLDVGKRVKDEKCGWLLAREGR